MGQPRKGWPKAGQNQDGMAAEGRLLSFVLGQGLAAEGRLLSFVLGQGLAAE